jgi:zinc transport system substrate-binding protein
MSKKKIIWIAVTIAIVAGIGGYAFFGGADQPASENGQHKLSVVTTLFPFYDFAKRIGGERVEVSLILPPGVEAHAFEPKPSDIMKIDQADVFVYTGTAMEPWAKDIAAGAMAKGVRVVDASAGISMIESVFHDEDEPAGALDPHIWLDFGNAAQIVEHMAEAFAEKDPAHADEYTAEVSAYQTELGALDTEYQTMLASCQTKTIIYGGHYAFGYLAHRYGLEYVAAQGLAPDAEPTAHDLAALIEQVRKDAIGTIFYEELTSPKIAETLAHETGTRLSLLNAAHNITKEDYTGGVTFMSLMEENLERLREGLKCSQ